MLKQRIITALVLAPVVIGCIFFLPTLGFSIFVAAVLTIGAWEWANLAGLSAKLRYAYAAGIAVLMAASTLLPPLILLVGALIWWSISFFLMMRYPEGTELWGDSLRILLIGVFALVPGLAALLVLKESADANFLILLLFFLIWGADIGAYFTGRQFGRKKLAPDVSPGKSWEGLYGGLLIATLIAVAMLSLLGRAELMTVEGLVFLAGCALVVLVSALGDLVISMFKRHRGIKDSSNLLPGHGGVLDRIDSLLSAGPLFAMLILLLGWQS